MDNLHQPDDCIGDRYRIIRALGRGGTSVTYEAEDLSNNHLVALKALSLQHLQDWKTLELFERESQTLEQLDHPAIPKYRDYFALDRERDRRFYLVQDLVSGQSLAALVEKGWRPDEAQVRDVAEQILGILQYLHDRVPPVIHRDLKPENLIRKPDGTIFLVDFGAVQDVYRATISRGATFVGTLGYMPPEQFRGQTHCACDLYALGATLLFLLTGQPPDSLPQQRMKLDFRQVVTVSPTLGLWLDKLLEPAVEDRFQTAGAALTALRDRNALALCNYPQPPPSDRLSVRQDGGFLRLDIAPRPWRVNNIIWLVLFLVAGTMTGLTLLIALLGILMALSEASFIALLFGLIGTAVFALPLWGVSWLFWWRFRMTRGARVHLAINPEAFDLQVRQLWIQHHHDTTSRLVRVAANWKYSSYQDTRAQLTRFSMVMVNRVYHFDAFLSRQETLWLEQVLSEFI